MFDDALMEATQKVLIFRFSSFGDVLQSLSVVGRISESWPNAEIHFCTRSEFVGLAENHPGIHKVWNLEKSKGLLGLLELGTNLSAENWTHIYDSHNNLRTLVLGFLLNGPFGIRKKIKKHQFLRRPMYRWKRFLLFKFKKNRFPQPFSGQGALLAPLIRWGLSSKAPPAPQLFFGREDWKAIQQKLPFELSSKYICLAPSAAHSLKRWPLTYFKEIVESLPLIQFVVLGGPSDTFLRELEFHGNVTNLAGRLSLYESSLIVSRSHCLISNDTGLMHVAEQTGVSCIALMGPAPFGFPSRPATTILQKDLSCWPCSKHGQGPCVNRETYQKCLVDIRPKEVILALSKVGVSV